MTVAHDRRITPGSVGDESVRFGNYYIALDRDAEQSVRRLVFDVDIGQRSWAYQRDFKEYGDLLKLNDASTLVDIGCNYGGPTQWIAGEFACRAIGVDVNKLAIDGANNSNLGDMRNDRLSFMHISPEKNLPMSDGTVSAVLSNDVICHVPNRLALLRDCWRILQPNGRILITDPLVVTGPISNNEVVDRNMRVTYFYSPPEYTVKCLNEAGFEIIEIRNQTDRLLKMAGDNLRFRAELQDQVVAAEGRDEFDRVTRQLQCVLKTATEGRLCRFMYLASKA